MELKNFHPISLLSAFFIILEKIVHAQILSYLEFHHSHHEFIKKNSTNSALTPQVAVTLTC